MSDTPMDVAYNPTVTDPIAATPNGIGMKRPQYMLNQPRQTQPKKIHDKPGVEVSHPTSKLADAIFNFDEAAKLVTKQTIRWE